MKGVEEGALAFPSSEAADRGWTATASRGWQLQNLAGRFQTLHPRGAWCKTQAQPGPQRPCRYQSLLSSPPAPRQGLAVQGVRWAEKLRQRGRGGPTRAGSPPDTWDLLECSLTPFNAISGEVGAILLLPKAWGRGTDQSMGHLPCDTRGMAGHSPRITVV